MQIAREGIEKKYFQKTQIQKVVFPCLFIWEWAK
jgi:hypothetical protein